MNLIDYLIHIKESSERIPEECPLLTYMITNWLNHKYYPKDKNYMILCLNGFDGIILDKLNHCSLSDSVDNNMLELSISILSTIQYLKAMQPFDYLEEFYIQAVCNEQRILSQYNFCSQQEYESIEAINKINY
jgi:hypothetical protein